MCFTLDYWYRKTKKIPSKPRVNLVVWPIQARFNMISFIVLVSSFIFDLRLTVWFHLVQYFARSVHFAFCIFCFLYLYTTLTLVLVLIVSQVLGRISNFPGGLFLFPVPSCTLFAANILFSTVLRFQILNVSVYDAYEWNVFIFIS